MAAPGGKDRRLRSAALSIIPVFVLVLSVIGSMAIIAQRAASREEQLAFERETHQLAQSLAYESEQLLQQVARDEALGELFVAQREQERAERILAAMVRRHSADYAALLTRTSGTLVSDSGESAMLRERREFAAALVDSSRMRGAEGSLIGLGRESRLAPGNDSLVQFVTVPVGRGLLLMLTRPISQAMLRRLSGILALPGLHLAHAIPAKGAHYTVQGFDGRTASLVWEPTRNFAEAATDLALYGSIAAFFVAAVAGLLFHSIRIETARLLRREAKAKFEARHDALSGLPNRAVFCSEVESALVRVAGNGGQIAVLLLDLDRFKEVNDTYGHAAGDKVILDFGKRVRAILHQTDTIARLGGDEFAVLLPNPRDQHSVGILAQAIIDATQDPFTLDGAALHVGVSVGVAMAPEDGRDLATLLRAADTALYRAKNEGRNRFAFYEQRLTDTERMRKLVDDELRGAIERDELSLVYQPQVDADTGRIAAVEALVRWRHPTHGIISPALFITAAEERNLIVPLGDWVLRRAARDAARWPTLRVGVNVSAIQFRQPNFVQHVTAIAAQCGIEPERLELELTEGVLVEHADHAELAMQRLREAGFRLALDDFGTGYSSMIYLRRFAFDKIKIDKSFLDSLEPTGESAILVHSVVHLGRALGLEVTAEGVETEEQYRFLKAVGCHYLQGFLFSKPVSADAIEAMLADEQRASSAA